MNMKRIPRIAPEEPKRRTDRVRRTVGGRSVPHYVDEQRLTISTQCPQKWLFVDLEDGNIWTKRFEEDKWRSASIKQLSDALSVINIAERLGLGMRWRLQRNIAKLRHRGILE
jgi:hypothetical protein